MTKVVFDKSMIDRLHNMNDDIEVCDEAGKILGHFIPNKHKIHVPFSEEELDSFEKNMEGRPLAEILRDLRRQ